MYTCVETDKRIKTAYLPLHLLHFGVVETQTVPLHFHFVDADIVLICVFLLHSILESNSGAASFAVEIVQIPQSWHLYLFVMLHTRFVVYMNLRYTATYRTHQTGLIRGDLKRRKIKKSSGIVTF